MDVRFNNIFESTRQYFQGLPVNNNATPGNALPIQNSQPLDNSKHPSYIGATPPNSRIYWQQQNEIHKTNDVSQRPLPSNQYYSQKPAETFAAPNSHLPPASTLSNSTANFPPFKSVHKVPHWSQYHPTTSTVASSSHSPHATSVPNTPVTVSYYPPSSQVSVTSSSNIFYYPPSEQAATSKSVYYYYSPNDGLAPPTKTPNFSSGNDPPSQNMFPPKSSTYAVNSKRELASQPPKSNSMPANVDVSSNSGYKLPVSSSKTVYTSSICTYPSSNESPLTSARTIYTNSNNVPRTTISFSNYGSSQGLYNMNSVTSQSNYRSDLSEKSYASRRSLKPSLNSMSAASTYSYNNGNSVPKIQSMMAQQPSNQINSKLSNSHGQNLAYFSMKAVPTSLPSPNESSKKPSNMSNVPVKIKEIKKKSLPLQSNFDPSVSTVLNENSKKSQQPPSNDDQNHNAWTQKKNQLVKRESPLDLSVKTVRQSADSTAKDELESNNFCLPGFKTLDFRFKPPSSEYSPSNIGYSPINQNESAVPTPSADFPKVNFNPTFNIPASRSNVSADHDKNYWKANSSDRNMFNRTNSEMYPGSEYIQSISQRPYHSEQSTQQKQQKYQEQHYQPLQSTSNNPPSSINNRAYYNHQPPPLVRTNGDSLTAPLPNNFPFSRNISQPLSADTPVNKKRSIPAEPTCEPKAKNPKVDSWLKTIDQQIEDKFSSYVTSRHNSQSTNSTANYNISTTLTPVDRGMQMPLKASAEAKPGVELQGKKMFGMESSNSLAPNTSLVNMNMRKPYLHPVSSDLPSFSTLNFDRQQTYDSELVDDNSLKIKDSFYETNDKMSLESASAVMENIVGNKSWKNDVSAVNMNSKTVSSEDHDKSAPRPRTKAELKQVGSHEFVAPDAHIIIESQPKSNFKSVPAQSSLSSCSEDVSVESKSEEEVKTPLSTSSVSPPKLTKEQIDCLPRKKLFEDEEGNEDSLGQVPSDSCIFDFRESDSECEMPVLERQTLHEMRKERDRRINTKIAQSTENLTQIGAEPEYIVPVISSSETKDPFWMETCNSFLEQLTAAPMRKKKKLSTNSTNEDPDSIDWNENNENTDVRLNRVDENTVISKVKKEIVCKDKNAGIPKVVIKDVKKEEEKCLVNLKLDKLSTNELKQEIAQLTNIKKELEEKLLESSSKNDKTEPLDELKSNCLHLKKFKSKSNSFKPKDIGNEENIKATSVSLKIRKRKRMKRLGSGESDPLNSSKNRMKDSVDVSKRLSESDDSKLELCNVNKRKKIKRSEEVFDDSNCKVVNNVHSSVKNEVVPKSKISKKLQIKKNLVEDSSESKDAATEDVSEPQKNIRKSDTVASKNDVGPTASRRALADTNNKRKMMKRRRANASVGGRPGLRSAASLRSTKSMLSVKRQKQLKSKKRKLSTKTKQVETSKNQGSIQDKELLNAVEPVLVSKKKFKLKSIRRKFRSSGFDYLRKKKKQMKKTVECDETKVKKLPPVRGNPESVDDLQAEVKGWVINKGLGESTLHRAARLGYPDAVAYCLEVLEVAASVRDNAGYTPLHEASHRGHLAIARMLLLYGADSSASAIGGIRPLHEAAENGHVELVRLLLSYGADPLLATYSGQTPLSLAHDKGVHNLLERHLADVQGLVAPKWDFTNSPLIFDEAVLGCDVLNDAPEGFPSNDADVEIEYSNNYLPCTFWLVGEPMSELWALWQEVAALLRLKSTDALLKLLGKTNNEILRELKPAEFAIKASNPSIFGATNLKLQNKCQKIVLVKYTEQLKSCMKIDKIVISSR